MVSPVLRIAQIEALAVADALVMLGRQELTPDERRVALHTAHLLAAIIVNLEDRVGVQGAIIDDLTDDRLPDAILAQQRELGVA